MEDLILIDNRNIYDPSLNLALEEYAVRRLEMRHGYLLLYENDPSVVVGRHQNVIEEVNLKKAYENNIPVYRRISGGGTVVHDRGNLNFSFLARHTLKDFNNYRKFLTPVVELLRESGIPVEINQRNNLIVNGMKISGNAQFSSRGNMISHGTLLYDADLERIRKLLRLNPAIRVQSRSSKSVPDVITNVRRYLNHALKLNDFKDKLIERLCGPSPQRYRFSEDDWRQIRKLADERYRRWTWNFGQSPPCDIKTDWQEGNEYVTVRLKIENGRIKEVNLDSNFLSRTDRVLILATLSERPYDYPTLQNLFGTMARQNPASSDLHRIPWFDMFF